jgi:hypothetical protein
MFGCCLTFDTADGLAGMKQGDLIIWYVEQQNAQGAYASQDEVKEEVKCLKAILEVKLKHHQLHHCKFILYPGKMNPNQHISCTSLGPSAVY